MLIEHKLQLDYLETKVLQKKPQALYGTCGCMDIYSLLNLFKTESLF